MPQWRSLVKAFRLMDVVSFCDKYSLKITSPEYPVVTKNNSQEIAWDLNKGFGSITQFLQGRQLTKPMP